MFLEFNLLNIISVKKVEIYIKNQYNSKKIWQYPCYQKYYLILVNFTEFSSFPDTRYFDFIDYCLYLRWSRKCIQVFGWGLLNNGFKFE